MRSSKRISGLYLWNACDDENALTMAEKQERLHCERSDVRFSSPVHDNFENEYFWDSVLCLFTTAAAVPIN